ncbi:MAG TPA: carbohydrate-binding domain-containing protein [Aeromicrobium sp.]|nr:carbohydrate-binding domain-containing protein [Aeromicrobium sp.]
MISTPTRSRTSTVLAVAALVAVAGCTKAKDGSSDDGEHKSSPPIAGTHAKADDGHYKARKATTVKLADGATKVKGLGAKVKGDVVTITQAGTYVFSGTLSDGGINVNSPGEGKVKLVLDGADISSASTSPVIITAADEAVVILADGTESTLSDAAAASQDDQQPDAPTGTLFSTADLTIAGSGSLTVHGKSNDGIVGKDGLVILAGSVTVDAVDDAVAGKDYLVVHDGTLSVKAGGDGLKSNGDTPGELGWIRFEGGKTSVESVGDGIAAEGSLTVDSGDVDVTKSDDGVKSQVVSVSGGTLSVTAIGDGIKASKGGKGGTAPGAPKVVEQGVKLTISDGTVHIDAGGDGIDSRGSATITGGVVTIGKSGKNAIDVVGTSKTPDRLTVPLATAGKVELKDAAGEVVASFTAAKAGPRLVIADGITTGKTYTVTLDGNPAGTVTAAAQP